MLAVGGKGRCAIVRNGNKYTGIIAQKGEREHNAGEWFKALLAQRMNL